MNWLRTFKSKEETKSPLELLQVATLGGEAATVKKVMGEVLNNELISIMSQFSGVKPDLGQYAFYAGQVSIIHKILRSLDLQSMEGKDAVEQLKGGY